MTAPTIAAPGSRDALVARLTRRIFVAVALGMTSVYAMITVAPLAAVELTGDEGSSGLPTAFAVGGTAAGATLLSHVMVRHGRRAGLLLGLVIALVGAATALYAMASGSFVALLFGVFLMGLGNAANQLARYAGADMHPVERRGSVISWIVWAGAIGAVMGPSLVPLFRPVARALDLEEIAGGFVIGIIFFLAAVLVYLLAIRTDPSSLARAADPRASTVASAVSASSSRLVVVAVVALATSQASMVLIMTGTPLQVTHAHHGVGAVSFVMGAHLFGMFALAPLAGKLADRFGSIAVIAAGAFLIAVAAAMAALMPAGSGPLLGAPLFLLGLGWSLGFVAGSALLSRALTPARATTLQGRIDALVWACSAASSLASGLLIESLGFAALSLAGMTLMLLPAALIAANRRSAPATT